MLSIIGLAIVLFVSTNVDDLFVLLGFFVDPQANGRHIAIGQYLGIAALTMISVVLSIVSIALAPAYVGLLGFVPMVIGAKRLFDVWWREGTEQSNQTKIGFGTVFEVAGVTIANGGDNIGICTPVFATSSVSAILIIVLVFAVMVALWLRLAHWLVTHPALSAIVDRFGHILTPFALIAIGVFVLWKGGTFSLML